jgi:hypothetical protein
MIVHFDYNIGDTVKLTKDVGYENQWWNSQKFEEIKDTVYKITKYEVVFESDKFTVYYRLLSPRSINYLKFHNRLTSEYLEPVGDSHSFDEDIKFISKDGKEIHIGDNIYAYLYSMSKANIRFTFTGYGQVYSMEYSYEELHTKPGYRVYFKRSFLCTTPNGKPYGDGRRFGNDSEAYASDIYFGADDKYIEDFAREYIKGKKYLSDYNNYEIKEWLNHLGVYDKVMDLVDKIGSPSKESKRKSTSQKKSSTKSKSKESGKLEKLLAGLTEEEKKNLKRLL